METCLGLGRSQRNLNKQQQKDLKLKDHHQKQHTKLLHQKQQTQAIITNQNYYTTQQQPQNQRHLDHRGQTTIVGSLKPGQQQRQHNEESHLLRQVQQQNVQDSATPTQCATTRTYRNAEATATTTANMQQLSLSTSNNSAGSVDSIVQPQPQTISLQKNTVTVEVTSTMPSSVSPTNIPSTVGKANVQTLHKINSQLQQQHQQHQYHHLLTQQQRQQLESDLDAIEVYVDPEPHVSFKGGGCGLSRTLGRLNHQHKHQDGIDDQYDQLTNMSQVTSLQLLQLQQHQQQDYSYAYYEPGAVIKHTNIPHTDLIAGVTEEEVFIPPPPNSIRALLLKGKKNKLLVSPTTRESYQLRLTQHQCHNVAGAMASANCSNVSTPENFYEEISSSSTSSPSKSMTDHHQLSATSRSAGCLTRTLVEEELRRVQNRHDKILGELNLSVEAMLMPDSPPNRSPTDKETPSPMVSVTLASGQPLRLISSSADNICDTALAGGPADDFISPIPNAATVSAGLLQSSCLVADLDSGFSGSSGASYIGSLRLHKTNALKSSRANNLSTATISTAGYNAAEKTQQSAFANATQICRSFRRANINNTNANATATSTSAASSSATVPALATTSSCTIKHLPQIHHNIKQEQQHPQLHQHQQHHHSHLHHHHHQHLLQQQQHLHQQHHQSQPVNNDGLHNSSSFFTRASCGCRILNCTKIRAAEDPGPVVLNAQPIESKARSFWKRKGWRKQPEFSTSNSNINDAG